MTKQDHTQFLLCSARRISMPLRRIIGDLSGTITVLLGHGNVPQEVPYAEWAN